LEAAERLATAPSRRARKKERTRREIYEAAMGLFEHEGFDAVTVEAVCQAADVARGTFFSHFPTKAALLYEFSNRVADDFDAHWQLHGDREAPARAELHALLDFMIGQLVAHAGVIGAMVRAFFSTPQALEAAHARGRAFPDRVETIIRRGQERGEFRRSVDARLASAVLLSTAGAILSGNVFPDGELPVQDIRAQFFEVIFGGLLEPGGATHGGSRQ
jgi:AcrR family transcriptional regulator